MSEATRSRRLLDALDRLLDLEAEQRDAQLAALDRDDPAFGTELRALLQAAGRDDGVLEAGAVALAPEALQQLAHGPEQDTPPGTRIGHWRLLRQLGRGGMGEVLLAERDDAGFVQQAALKRLKRGMDSDELLRRFGQERRILATLEHRLIARLLDGGVDEAGRPYFVMEYVDGVPITRYAAEQGLGLRERVALMQQVCEAVAYAQERLVVHRDLKPSNVLVDARGTPRLLDFGIAKLIGADPDATQTYTGLRAMSPAYAAPEQIRGEAISTATDVYSLGVLLFELLTGSLPHARRGDPDGLVAAVSQEVIDPPSRTLRRAPPEQAQRAWGARANERTRLVRRIEGDLDRIVQMALRAEPERRYPTAAALAGELGHFLAGRPIAARGDRLGYRLRKLVQRNKVGAAAIGLAVLSLFAGLGVALWQAERARVHAAEAEAQRALAQAQAQVAAEQARRAERVKDFAIDLFSTGNPELTRGGATMSAADLLQEAAARIDRELADAPQAQAELRVALSSAMRALGRNDDAQALAERSIAQLRRLDPPEPAALAEAMHQAAMANLDGGRMEVAERLAREALGLLRPDRGAHAMTRIGVRTTLAKIATFRGDLASAAQEFRAILDDRRALFGADDPRVAVDWNNLGSIASRRDAYAEAEEAYREASRLLALDPQAPESRQAWLRLGRGHALIGLGAYPEAEREFNAARDLVERHLHTDHPLAASIDIARARLFGQTGRFEASIAAATRARELYDRLAHPERGSAALELGLALAAAQRDDAARSALQDAVRDYVGVGARTPGFHLAQAALAALQVEAGTIRDTQAIDAALDALQREGHARSRAYAEALGWRARAASRLESAEAAASWRARELAALEALLGPGHPRVVARAACTGTAADCPRSRP